MNGVRLYFETNNIIGETVKCYGDYLNERHEWHKKEKSIWLEKIEKAAEKYLTKKIEPKQLQLF